MHMYVSINNSTSYSNGWHLFIPDSVLVQQNIIIQKQLQGQGNTQRVILANLSILFR